MSKRAVKSTTSPIPITTPLNISALARAAGVSRKTIARRLANGWRPEAPSVAPTPRTPAQAHPKPVGHAVVRKGLLVKRVVPVPLVFDRARTPTPTHERPPLGVVRTVLLLVAVAFYVFVGWAAVHR